MYIILVYLILSSLSELYGLKDTLLLVMHYSPEHLAGTWIMSHNQNSDRLPQKFTQNLKATLQVAIATYNPQDDNTARKIFCCLNTLEVGSRDAIEPFMSNPRLVSALSNLHDVPIWCLEFLKDNIFRNLHTRSWGNEVSVHYCFIY